MTYRYPTIKVDGRTKLLHRHVAEQALGRALTSGEEVHHKNEDRFDPAPENLDVLPAQEHRALHADLRLVHPRHKTCVVCGLGFTPHPTKRKRQMTCSVACANIQRGRSEKATKAAMRLMARSGTPTGANVALSNVSRRAPRVEPLPLLTAAE